MTLLLVPVMIAAIAPWFTLWQNNSQRTLEAQQRAQEAENRAQSAALQDYLGQMSQLIKEDGLQQSDEGDTVFTLAQARTITTIRQLDGGRNQIVTRFLTELGLLRVPALLAKVNLEGAELAKAELQEANLVGTQLNSANLAGALLINADFSAENQTIQANLTKADLSKAALLGADLSGCFLKEATLTDATLQSAKLRSADLRGADLSRAALQGADLSAESPFEGPFNPQDAPLRFLKRYATNLTDADLSHAALQEADLRSAVLQNANLTNADLTNTNFTDAYLSNANLTEAKGWTMEQLTAARSLEGATMPNGQTLKSDKMPHRPTFEEWLKDRES